MAARTGYALFGSTDVTKPDDIARMFQKVRADFGTLDVFVSNARPEVPFFFHPPMEITLEQLDSAFDSQVKAFLVGAREASALIGKGGRIVALTYAPGSRTGGLLPWVGMGSAKAAMESLVRYFAVALAKRGITVNAISPGWTEDSVLNTLPTQAQAACGHGEEGADDEDDADGKLVEDVQDHGRGASVCGSAVEKSARA